MTVIHRMQSPEELAAAATEYFLEVARESIEARGMASIALAGGTTPRPTYERIAAALPVSSLDPLAFYVFWGDERCVPPDDPMSNYRMAHGSWLGASVIPGDQIHPLRCEGEAKRGAAEYEEILRAHFPGREWPRFDLIFLGLGSDGHTASLFPGSQLIDEDRRWVAAEFAESIGGWRATLTPMAINAARNVAFLVEGKEKSEAVRRVIVGEHDPSHWPAQIVEPSEGQLHWFLDEAAAILL